jgi:phospholipid-transporting ATPase
MVITFGIILLFTSIREGIEDYKRHKKDRKANEKRNVYFDDKIDKKGFEYKQSKKIHVGDIIKVIKDEELPVDICVLKSSNMNGICFVDTVNLDGESNLKDKKCNQNTQNLSDYEACTVTGMLICDKPNDQLDYWQGYLTLNIKEQDEIKLILE